MLASSSWSAAGARPPRPRPMSAKPTRVHSARPEMVSYSRNNDFDEEEEVVEDDDGEDFEGEFGAAAEREHRLQQQARQLPPQRRHWSGKPTLSDANNRPKSKFRPSSAPARRPKSAVTARNTQDNDDKQSRSAAAISIAYLRAAAEKKKARDREFARELFREENEFKKKMSVKVEQANKMMAASGSSKSFGPAPDRDGIHMIRVFDPASGDRVITAEIFLREFEQLATVPLGQTKQHVTSSAPSIAANKYTSKSTVRRSSLTRGSIAPRAARLSSRREPQSDVDITRSRITKAKPADRSQVQEELRGVLEGTIELTKILQEQLNELRLKGWNVPPHS